MMGEKEAEKIIRKITAKYDIEFFARYYFPHFFPDPTPEWHFELDRIVEEAIYGGHKDKKGTVIIAPRGHAKTTRLTFLRVMHEILFNDNQEFILIISDTGQQTEKMITSLKSEFEMNERLLEDFGDLVGDRYFPPQNWNNTNLTICWPKPNVLTKTGRPYVQKTKLIAGRSAGSSLRGLKHRARRPTLVILDDIENREEVDSPVQREKMRSWFWSDVVPMLDPEGTIVVVGTILHYDCLLEHLVKSDLFNSVRFQAVKPNGTPLWPERFPLEYLESLKQSMGSLIFNQEFMNIPMSEDTQVFKPEGFSWYTKHEIEYDDEKGWLFKGEPLTLYTGVDPAIGEKEQNDETAIVTIGVTKTHDIVVMDVKHGRWPFTKQVDEIVNTYYDYAPYIVGIETVAYQRALKQAIQEKDTIPVRSLEHKGDKYMRLVKISGLQESGKIYLREALPNEFGHADPMNRIPQRIHGNVYPLYEQMIQFPKSAHDDMIDALENAISMSTARKFFERGDKNE